MRDILKKSRLATQQNRKKYRTMLAKTDTSFVKDALFISYTGLNDFSRCPRAYYLKNVYRDPKTGYKLQIASPYLTLGGVVHDSLKWFLDMNRQVTKDQLISKFRNLWLKYRGKRGGFIDISQEAEFGKRGLSMLEHFYQNAQVLEPNLEVDSFLKYRLSPRIFLNGKLDFLGELPDSSLHVLDFKTGIKDEEDPLQLYIYAILAESNYQKPVTKISYWYIDRDTTPKEAVLDPLDERLDWITKKAQEIEKMIQEGNWICIKDPELCRDCQDYQNIIEGKGEFLFSDDSFKKQVYFLDKSA